VLKILNMAVVENLRKEIQEMGISTCGHANT
jgi:hypothetical protein